jgi:hypothetical protein
MRQLVGSLCGICEERIHDIVEGRFCDACGIAVHNRCTKKPLDVRQEDCCETCGANLSAGKALADHQDKERRMRAASAVGYPVSLFCPKCGSAEYKKRKPEKWIAFIADRVCTECQTRYTPPTPAWAGIIFILAGLPLASLGFLGAVFNLGRGGLAGFPAMACEGFLGIIGVLAIVHGIRSLAKPGKI